MPRRPREVPAVAIRVRTGNPEWTEALVRAVMDAIEELGLPLDDPKRGREIRRSQPHPFTDTYLTYKPRQEAPRA